MRVALLIAAKDLRQRFRDRSALIFAIAAPLGLALIFSRLIGPSAGFHATWVVVDLDGGSLATVLRDDVIGGVAKAGIADVTDLPTEAAARTAVEDGTADAAFVIPQGFTMAIQSGRPTTVEVVGSRTSGLSTDIAHAVAAQVRRGRGRQPAGGLDGRDARRRVPAAGRRRAHRAGRGQRAAAGLGGRGHGRPPPARPPDVLQRLDGDPVPVLLGADRAVERVRGAAAGHPAPDPRRTGRAGHGAGRQAPGRVRDERGRDGDAGRGDDAADRRRLGPGARGRGADRRRDRGGARGVDARDLVHPLGRGGRVRERRRGHHARDPRRDVRAVRAGTRVPRDPGAAHAARLVPARARRPPRQRRWCRRRRCRRWACCWRSGS